MSQIFILEIPDKDRATVAQVGMQIKKLFPDAEIMKSMTFAAWKDILAYIPAKKLVPEYLPNSVDWENVVHDFRNPRSYEEREGV